MAEDDRESPADAGTRAEGFRHPLGIYVICTAEMLQRTAYFGARAGLLLFLTIPLANGGFGWTDGASLQLFGLVVAFYLAAPLAGGFLADRTSRHRQAVLQGGVIMTAGYLGLLAAIAWPALLDMLIGPGSAKTVIDLGRPLGSDILSSLPAAAIVNAFFYGSLALIVLGNGLYQTNGLSLVDELYAEHPSRRDAGFTYHYVASSVGAVASALVVGTIGERADWIWGFAAAAIAMAIGAAVLIFGIRSLPAKIHLKIPAGETPADDASFRKSRMIVLVILVFSAMFYTVIYEQFSGLITLYARDFSDRSVGRFEIPATWIPQFVAVYGIFLGFLSIRVIDGLAGTKGELSVPEKFAFGFALAALTCIIMIGAVLEGQAQADGRSHLSWLIIAMLVLELGSVVLWPVGFSVAARLAPSGKTSIALSIWLLIAGSAGSWLSGVAGSWILSHGLALGFGALAVGSIVFTCALLVGQARLNEWANDTFFAGRLSRRSIENGDASGGTG